MNLLGPPGAGKSVAAASIYSKTKKRHVDTVLVPEFATDKVIEENSLALKNQLYIWANQQYKIFCGHHHARVVVTDSPILLGAIYNKESSSALYEVILEEHRKYNNLNIIMELDPDFPYSMVGRIHSFTESQSIGNQIVELLEMEHIPYMFYNQISEDEIVDLIVSSIS